MDAQAKKKLFRAKLNSQKQEKQRINSPFVRYNEHDQPVCKVCDIVIKSELLWPAHQVSRKHHEAIDKLKAKATELNQANISKTEPPKQFSRPITESYAEVHEKSEPSTAMRKDKSSMLPSNFFDNQEMKRQEKSEPSTAMPKDKSSMLPPNFFDNQDTKRQKKEMDSGKLQDPDSGSKGSISAKIQVVEPLVSGSGTDKSSSAKHVQKTDPKFQSSKDFTQGSKPADDLDAKQVKGSLPKGFFDDQDADLRARGIKPVKPDVKDEYKEFEKLIKEDLQEVDDRLEEEEIDTAEMIQEAESVEQRTYRERVELLRRKKLELRASRSALCGKDTEVMCKESSHDESSSDDDNNENFVVDWRAKHL